MKRISGFKGKQHSEESKQKNRLSHLGRKVWFCWNKGLTKETNTSLKKLSEKCMGRIPWNKNKPWSEETKMKMRKPRMSTINMIGKKRTDEGRKNNSLAKKKSYEDLVYKEKLVKSMFKSFRLKPNKSELFLFGRVCDFSSEYFLNTKGEVMCLGGKIPDIVNVKGQKIIELYGDYWHRNDNAQDRILHFKQFGWDTLIVWEHELKNNELLKSKLMGFIGET